MYRLKYFKNIILAAVLNVCEIWSLIKGRIDAVENRVLRGIFSPKRDEVIEGWRK
jgi:hypothetical protein